METRYHIITGQCRKAKRVGNILQKKMKNFKFLVTLLIAGLFLITMNGCKKCKGENPKARIINNGTQKASVQIKTSNGNTENINNVDPGTSSAYSSYAAGLITFTIDVNSKPYVKIVELSTCYNYDIAIDANNNITATAINRN